MSEAHVFTHEAMKTIFTFRIASEDRKLAQDAAYASIALLDEIENTLSRYVVGSDIWLINHMQAGETRFLSECCYDCLRLALEAYVQTGGLFDITLGRQIEHQKNSIDGPSPALQGQLMVDPDKPAIHCTETGREIDLGGIGKGYALDEIQKLMQEWGIESGLLSAGGSTQLAFGPNAWDIELRGDQHKRTIKLKDQALSASGTGIQGSHIVSPFQETPSYQYPRIWCIQNDATYADAWSTAMMLMDQTEIGALATAGAPIYVETELQIARLTNDQSNTA
ncbi:MAG: FAD:protein FMN transferase [Opitutaceae bacterium]